MELHHIKLESEGGEESFENCIPLCFDCHSDQRSYDHNHPKGTKYTRKELEAHRDKWYGKVAASPTAIGSEDYRSADRGIFSELLKLLPWDGSISFIRVNNFAGWSYERSRLHQLRDYLYRCEDPGFEFHDADLEACRADLTTWVKAFLLHVGQYTFPSRSESGLSEVPDEWEEANPERYHKAVNDLHTSASAVCDAYDRCVRSARRKLAV